MRTLEELNSPEFNDDMTPLVDLLKKKKIKHDLLRHGGARAGVKELIGYYPTGEWHVLIYKGKKKYSVIKGMASFGLYELADLTKKVIDPIRFRNPEEVISEIMR